MYKTSSWQNLQTSAFLFAVIIFSSCQSKKDTIKPIIQPITESVYASGLIESKNQYQVFSTVSGIVDEVFVDEGVAVEIGSPILFIVNDVQQLMAANSKLTEEFNALHVNSGKIDEARSMLALAKSQMKTDSSMLERQRRLWSKNIGTKIALEQKELAYTSSKANYESAKERLEELQRQLKYLAKQAENNLLISNKTTGDYLVKSKVRGKVYQLNLAKGEIVSPQIPIAIIGDDENYLLKMQIDENDITAIKVGMSVLVALNSYPDSVFNAKVSKIYPIMNLQSKTFTIEAEFVQAPHILYPNISFEANVVISTKNNALLIPRNYLLHDSLVVNKSGKQIPVKTGLKDYQMVEILSGIDKDEELILPE